MKTKGFSRNGVRITVEDLPDRKLPKLCVSYKGENRVYSIATFSSKSNAAWFLENLEKFFEGMITDVEEVNKA